MCETFKSKLCEASILDECVVEFPDEGSVVDECAEGSAVVERKLEVLELPGELELVELELGELELVELPGECAVVVVAVLVDKVWFL